MARVIALNDKIPTSRERAEAWEKQRKQEAAFRAYQSFREARCEKCFIELGVKDVQEGQIRHARAPYRFCRDCAEEYMDYILRLQGQGDADCYWRNDRWLEAWRRWIDYRGSLDSYLRSEDFRRFLSEYSDC